MRSSRTLRRRQSAPSLRSQPISKPVDSSSKQPDLQLPTAADTTTASPARNEFQIRAPRNRQEVDELLETWDTYFKYKDAKLSSDRKKADGYKNFANVAYMIEATRDRLADLSDDEVLKRVHLSTNNADGNVAGIRVDESEEEHEQNEPLHIDDLIANPKGLVPRRTAGETGDRLVRPKDAARKKLIPGSKDSYKGGGRALVERAIMEAGEDGISLSPLDETAAAQYRKMDFNGRKFESRPGLLTLKAGKK